MRSEIVCAALAAIAALSILAFTQSNNTVIFTDYRGEKPGVIHRITVKDLPPPDATPSVDNGPDLVRRPATAWPQAPAGFRVELYASD